MTFFPSSQPSCVISRQNGLLALLFANSSALGAEPAKRAPTTGIFIGVCASTASGARTLTARMTATPIRRMGTSVSIAAGSLAEGRDGLFDHVIRLEQERLRNRQT